MTKNHEFVAFQYYSFKVKVRVGCSIFFFLRGCMLVYGIGIIYVSGYYVAPFVSSANFHAQKAAMAGKVRPTSSSVSVSYIGVASCK